MSEWQIFLTGKTVQYFISLSSGRCYWSAHYYFPEVHTIIFLTS